MEAKALLVLSDVWAPAETGSVLCICCSVARGARDLRRPGWELGSIRWPYPSTTGLWARREWGASRWGCVPTHTSWPSWDGTPGVVSLPHGGGQKPCLCHLPWPGGVCGPGGLGAPLLYPGLAPHLMLGNLKTLQRFTSYKPSVQLSTPSLA